MFFSLNPLVQEQMPQLAQKISKIDSDLVPERILEYLSSQNGKESQKKVLQELLHLPSPIIQKYVKDAFNHDWPFLPPTINPTIMKVQNAEIPVLTEIELLLLCLNFAFESEEYKLALSIAFVVDRFVYWCDGSVALLKIIDQIQKLAPSTPVAPQLAIRKARVLKDNGDLHGSIQILNTLIDQKWEDVPSDDSSSRWQYKTEDQYINVCAVCIQIKGQIYHNLGLWKEAITPLMESIKGFKKLPVEDFKGTSFSYSLISRCLRQLSRREYRDLCKEYSFLYDHHYYQAYSYGIEAFKTSPGQRLFMSKHLLQSGECLLMYAVQLTDGDFQYKMFRKILRLLVVVVSYQNKEEFSQSKDQLFVFIKTLFVISLTLGCSFNHLDRDMSHYLENISMFVYEKFCEIGVNQLDSEIGKKKLQEIAPAFSNALTKLCEQYEKVGVTATKGDTHPVDITKIIDDIINPEADIQERLHLLQIKTKKIEKPKENTIEDCKTDTHGETREKVTPIVDCKVDSQEKVEISKKKRPTADCNKDTQERVETPEKMIPIVDCNKDTRERVETPEKIIPIVDCNKDTQERVETPEKMIPIVDCNKDTRERVETPEKMKPIVDCNKDTRERVETPEKMIPIVDCNKDTRERVETPEKMIQIVDCNKDTRENLETPEKMIPIVDCNIVTRERVETPEKMTPIVDCIKNTRERVETPEKMTLIVDCIKDTRERVETPEKMIPIVDSKIDTQDRVEAPEKMTPIVDYKVDTRDSVEMPEKIKPIVDCQLNSQDRGCTNISSYDSGFASFGSLSAGLNHNSLLKPRIVGLPSRVSDIERKVSSLAKFCRKVNDFNPDTDASAVQNEDASLVNLSALTAMRQSKIDGTFSANRLLNKFQRQVSFANEPQVNIPSSRTDELESSSSYLGKYLQMLVSKDLLLSTTNFPCQGFKRTIDSTDKDVRVNKVQKATLYQYNPVTGVWSGQDTLVCTGKELTLGKGKTGSFRNVYEITFLHQDEPLGKYVSKRYREQKEPLHYMDDIVCQMQAGLYVNLFNQALKTFELDLRIYFLTAAYMLLYDSQGNVKDWLNIEPYVDGEFLKLTNNYDFCHPCGKKVSTSFTHFSYVQSLGKIMVTDLQGWLPTGSQNLIYLTDPQFHTDSGDSSPFDFGQEGMKVFFDIVHPECNEICKTLKLERPKL